MAAGANRVRAGRGASTPQRGIGTHCCTALYAGVLLRSSANQRRFERHFDGAAVAAADEQPHAAPSATGQRPGSLEQQAAGPGGGPGTTQQRRRLVARRGLAAAAAAARSSGLVPTASLVPPPELLQQGASPIALFSWLCSSGGDPPALPEGQGLQQQDPGQPTAEDKDGCNDGSASAAPDTAARDQAPTAVGGVQQQQQPQEHIDGPGAAHQQPAANGDSSQPERQHSDRGAGVGGSESGDEDGSSSEFASECSCSCSECEGYEGSDEGSEDEEGALAAPEAAGTEADGAAPGSRQRRRRHEQHGGHAAPFAAVHAALTADHESMLEAILDIVPCRWATSKMHLTHAFPS